MLITLKYSPDQPRDEGGRWTSTGAYTVVGKVRGEVYGEWDVLDVHDATNIMKDSVIIAVKVRGDGSGRVLASNGGEGHNPMIRTVETDKDAIDSYVRFYQDYKSMGTLSVSTSYAAVPEFNYNETKAMDNIYKALDILTAKGMPTSTPVRIQIEDTDYINTTAKEFNPNQPRDENGRWAKTAPTLPPELQRGSVGDREARLKVRADIMERTYGVKFSRVANNPLGTAEGKKLGIPGAGLPRAIYDKSFYKPGDVVNPERIKLVKDTFMEVARKQMPGMYLTFTTMKFATGMSFQDLFKTIGYMHTADPYSVSFAVDRLGKNTAVKIK